MDLKACFNMEYNVSQGILFSKPSIYAGPNDSVTDFFEGVRAKLVEKDHKPKWAHSSVNEITQEMVDHFFNYASENNLEIANEK